MIKRVYLFCKIYFAEFYFCFFSRIYLKRWKPEIIVITGSVGKTSLMNLLQLQFQDQALYSYRANTKLGVCLHMLDLPRPTKDKRYMWLLVILLLPFKAIFFKVWLQKYYLVEYDNFSPDASYFFKWWLRPKAVIWLSADKAHLENFDRHARKQKISAHQVALNYFVKLAKSASEKVFILEQDTLISQTLKGHKLPIQRVKNLLLNHQVNVQRSVFQYPDLKFEFSQPMPIEYGNNLALMKAVCVFYKIKVSSNLDDYEYPLGRSTILRGYKDCLLLDSTFNAQLKAVEVILKMFKDLKTDRQKWLVIGDMIELGQWSQKAHQILAQKIIEFGASKTFVIGRRFKKFACPIFDKNKFEYSWIQTIDIDFIKSLKSEIDGSEIILFKGAGYLDMIVEALLKDKADKELLFYKNRLLDKLGVENV